MTEANVARVFAVLAWLWLATAVPFLTDTGCELFVGLWLAASWILLGTIWLAVAPLWWRVARCWWLTAGLAGCLGLLFSFTNVGLRLRVVLSESSLTAYASEVTPENASFLHGPRRVGLFQVDGEASYDGIVFFYTSQSFLNREGLAYVPSGKVPGQIPRHSLQHLYGQWYWASWRF